MTQIDRKYRIREDGEMFALDYWRGWIRGAWISLDRYPTKIEAVTAMRTHARTIYDATPAPVHYYDKDGAPL